MDLSYEDLKLGDKVEANQKIAKTKAFVEGV